MSSPVDVTGRPLRSTSSGPEEEPDGAAGEH